MKKLLFSFLLIAGFAISSEAQIGIRAGLNISKFVYDGDGLNLSADSRVGFHIGVVKDFVVSEKLGFRPGVLYSIKGAKSNDNTSNFQYLEIPLDFVYKIGEESGFSLTAGPYVGILMSAKVEDMDVKDNAESTDFGINFGLGYDLNQITLGVQYGFGLSNIDQTVDEGSVKNTNISIYGIYNL